MNLRELVGKRFGRLTVKSWRIIDNTNYLLCECDCEKVFPALASSILSGDMVDCGCKCGEDDKLSQYIGKRYGRLIVTEHIGNTKFKCKCDCGNEVETTASALDNGFRKSCGCQSRKDRQFKALPEDITYPFKVYNITILGDNGDKDKNKQIMHCVCDCGTVFYPARYLINSGNVRSCGCEEYDSLDYGKNIRYGKLITERLIHNKKEDRYDWICRCDCGNHRVVRRSHLKAKKVSMCEECEAKASRLRSAI